MKAQIWGQKLEEYFKAIRSLEIQIVNYVTLKNNGPNINLSD